MSEPRTAREARLAIREAERAVNAVRMSPANAEDWTGAYREAFERARAHDDKAKRLRSRAAMMIADAQRYERWAAEWRDWADDDYGEVPYPGGERPPTPTERNP